MLKLSWGLFGLCGSVGLVWTAWDVFLGCVTFVCACGFVLDMLSLARFAGRAAMYGTELGLLGFLD